MTTNERKPRYRPQGLDLRAFEVAYEDRKPAISYAALKLIGYSVGATAFLLAMAILWVGA